MPTPQRSVLRLALTLLAASATPLATCAADSVWLTDLDLTQLHFAGWRKPTIVQPSAAAPAPAPKGKAPAATPTLKIAGRTFDRGVGTFVTSALWLELDGRAERFEAMVGVDDSAADKQAAVIFSIIGDEKKLWDSGVIARGAAARKVDVPLAGVRSLLLKIECATEPKPNHFADWAEARFAFAGERPRTVRVPREEAVILTPAASAAPRLNGPRVYGCRPGNPFLYRIPTTGERPMTFAAEGLPPTLTLDAARGLITGTAPARGTFAVTLRARNARGEATRPFKIVSGSTLALTPPMGWNHWYAHYNRITDAMMREAADIMVRTGMADVGYAYVSIDDCWSNIPDSPAAQAKRPDPARVGPARDAQGNILTNRHFPDMRALTEHIHAHGLKAGIYTSPGPLTCAGFAASYEHEEQDARQFAAWGFDFLKYDWCSYGRIVPGDATLAARQKPYRQMGSLVERLPRDVVFNLCQYGHGNVWEWGEAVGGQCWRTADDLGGHLSSLFDVALKNAEHRAWSRPGAWNDPDYVQIGWIGDARGGGEPQPCPMTPTGQYSFMSLWALMAAPIFYSGDLTHLDAFTLNVLCNPEVIDIDQDPLGESARVVKLTRDTFLMIKTLDDGSKAVGLGNRGDVPVEITAKWSDLDVTGPQRVRDVWRQRDLGVSDTAYRARVPRHGVVLLRMATAK
ncbi:MAG: NPCBM/NEW2 domain-containing protein [Verrucomicrobia bacterium]|nr:NPCBM/NEW2 domain-containing protein [Verrucomicrobiota bacterium]